MQSSKINMMVVMLVAMFVGRASAAPVGPTTDQNVAQNGLDVLAGLLNGIDSQLNMPAVGNTSAPTVGATSVAPPSYGPPPPPPSPPPIPPTQQCKDKTIQSTDTNPFPKPPPPPPPPTPSPPPPPPPTPQCKDKSGVVLPVYTPPPPPPIITPAYGNIPTPKVSGTSTVMTNAPATSANTFSSSSTSSDVLASVLGSASTGSDSGSSLDNLLNSSSSVGSLEAALTQNSVQMPAIKPSAITSGSVRMSASMVIACGVALLAFLTI